MPIKLKLTISLGVAFASWLVALPATADEQFAVSSVITIPGNPLASFDISFVDPAAGVYLLADRSNKSIDVINTTDNSIFKQLQPGFVGVSPSGGDFSGPNGVLTVRNTKARGRALGGMEVWAGDGNSKVWALQLSSGRPLHAAISTAINGPGTDPTRADELCYDSDHGIILIANPASSKPAPFVTFISTSTFAVLGHYIMNGKVQNGGGEAPPTVDLSVPGAGIEQCQYSPRTKMFYLNVPRATVPTPSGPPPHTTIADLVLQIDPVSMQIKQTVNVNSVDSNCVANHGMTIGPKPQIALGCNSGSSSVIISEDFSNNSTSKIADLPGEQGTDENWYNPGDNHYFFANSSNPSGPRLGVVDATGENGPGSTDFSPETAAGAHSVAADPVANQVYVPIKCVVAGGTGGCNDTTAKGDLTICSSKGGDDKKGCIAVFTVKAGTGPDDPGP
jgi:hypothetical protein